MTDYVSFEAQVEPLEWGKSTYTILRLPDEVLAELGHPKRVEGEMNDHPVNLAPQKAPVLDVAFLWTGKALLAEIGAEPGDVLEVRLRAADPDHVETPEDVSVAVRSAGLSDRWEAWSPGKRRGALSLITKAKRADTRAKRISALLAELEETG